MRRTGIKYQATVILFLMALLFSGCGSEDLLDENHHRYITDLAFADADEEDVLTADALYNSDCNYDGVADDPETFTDLYAIITITPSDENSPGLEMTDYEITFTPLRSYDNFGNPQPPPVVEPYRGAYSVIIPRLTETTFWITCMEMDLKRYIGRSLDFATDTEWGFRYLVTIVMHFVDELDEPRDITLERTIWIGGYDNC